MCLPAFRQAHERKSGFYDPFLGCFDKPQQTTDQDHKDAKFLNQDAKFSVKKS